MNKGKMIVLVFISAFLVLFFTYLSVISTNLKIEESVQESIATQYLQELDKVLEGMDIEEYEKFLENPTKNEYYWEIRNYLNDVRLKTGALYVYTLDFISPQKMKGMVMGMPNVEKGYEIGEPCTVPSEYVKGAFFENKDIVTDILHDHTYDTSYMTVAIPIQNKTNENLGYLAFDISANNIEEVKAGMDKNNLFLFISNATFIVIIVFTFSLIQRWYQRKVKMEIESTEDTYQSEMKNLIASVSSLRHDFTNHLQVIHGLLLLNEVEKAQNYTDSLVKDVRIIESLKMNVQHTGLGILLQMKKLVAQNNQIEFISVISDNPFNKVKSTDLIKILSNLLDNAIDAALELPEEERKIHLNCYANKSCYEFTVVNSGPISKDSEEVFRQGYTTKKQEEGKVRGQGLFIVKQTVEKYNGEISIECTSEFETTATVRIPIR